MEKVEKIKEVKECCTARDVLWYLVFLGFGVNYMIRINLNLAIVSMVRARPRDNVSLTSECLASTITYNISNLVDNSTVSQNISEGVTLTVSATALPKILINENDKFDWDEKQQAKILGSFFWLHWVTQIPGGILAGRYGTKIVFGLSNFTGVLCCFAIPFCAYMSPNYLMLLRVFQGLLCGFCWPAMHNMTARWIPPNERSKFVTAYLGSSVGAALTYAICGFIIDRWGWEYVFYVSGVIGTLWYVAWFCLVYDSPAEHPRITNNEKEYITTSLGQSVAKQHKEKAPVPWRSIVTSRSVWMNILAQWGGVWGLFTLMTHTPTYFKFIHGWDIRATGLLSGMPHLFRMVWAWIFSQLGDYLLRSNKMTRTNVRKLATAVCCIGQGLFMLGLAYSGCNSTAAIVLLTIAIATHGAVSTGPLASIVDLSPNYASVILGIINTIVAFAGFLTPAVVGQLTYKNQTVHQWQKVFWVSASFLFSSGILYVLFAKSELQPWNSPEKDDEKESEMMVIKKKEEELNSERAAYEKVPTVPAIYTEEEK